MQALEPVLGGDCHFMPEDPSDEVESDTVLCQYLSSRLLEGVAASRAVLLLQTHSAYTDALTLLELYWAIRQKKTIICLRLQGQPYDFGEVHSPIRYDPGAKPHPEAKPHGAILRTSQMSGFLENLEVRLRGEEPETAELIGAWLEENMISWKHMANSLAEVIPAVLTLPVAFSPSASENGIIATLEDIAMRLHCEDACTLGFAPAMPTASPQALKPKLQSIVERGSNRRVSLGAMLVQSVQGFSKSSGLLHAAAYGELTSHKMFLLVLCSTFISALWRGHVARKHAAHLRAVRDATILIAWYARDWLKRRRKHIAAEAEQEQSPTASKESHGVLDWRLSRLRALSRLREARARDERVMQLRRQASSSKGQVFRMDLERDADVTLALLIIAHYAHKWVRHLAAARAASLRRALEEQAAALEEQAVAAALEEERLKKMTKEMIEIGPDLLEAKQHMRNRRGARRMSCPF